jgi:NAD(P)H-hydrate repair Nnr-like enzyme with NAD(P)H-hydrate dehydratase domain
VLIGIYGEPIIHGKFNLDKITNGGRTIAAVCGPALGREHHNAEIVTLLTSAIVPHVLSDSDLSLVAATEFCKEN